MSTNRRDFLQAAGAVAFGSLLLPDTVRGEDPQQIPEPAPRIPAGAWKSVFAGHARLIGPKTHVQALAKAKPAEYKIVRAQTSLLAVGIVQAVEGAEADRIQPHLAAAERNAQRGVTNVHQDTWIWLDEAALAFDLFHEQIPDEKRQTMVQWMNGHLEKYDNDEGAFHNSTLSKILTYFRIACATRGENPRADEFRDYALRRLYEGRVAPVLRGFGAGGGFTECGWYSRHSLWHLVEVLELARRLEGYDGFQQAPRFFYQRLAYELLQPYPGLGENRNEIYAVEGDGVNTYGVHREAPRHMRTVLAQYFRGSELARYIAARRRPGSNPEARVVDFLYDEPPDAPADLKDFPPAHCASRVGKVYARSDWSDEATWLRFECGPFWNNHQHFEVGNFEVFRYEPLATESGEYADYGTSHSVNWLLRTIAHNCILVFQPGEQWPRLRDGARNVYANDGGQTNKWGWPAPTLNEWKKQPGKFERGTLVAYDNRPQFLFTAGDCTKAYSPAKLDLWVRQIVFLRPSTLVIFDRVAATQAEYQKTWLLHMKNEPQISGNTVTISSGKGRLVSETLLPEQPGIQKIYGYTYGGQTFNERETRLTPLAAKWRIEVRPPSASREDLFLHVLWTGQPQPARLQRKGDAVGVQVGQAEVLFSGKVGGTLRLAGRELPLEAGLKLGKYE
jgi:hypothetical protein